MEKLKISKEEARNMIVNCQRFDGCDSVESVLSHLGYIQIDTLSVAERAHNHTVFSRNKNYKSDHLNNLIKEKKAFEYWSHAAAYLPIEDYRFSLIRKREYTTGKQHWFKSDKKVEKYVLDRIKAEGPLQSKDFKHHEKIGEWYDWKPSKIALEQLFMSGKLMVSERQKFQKVYDLTERVLPESINTIMPSSSELAEHLIIRAINQLGLASIKEIIYLRKGIRPSVEKAIKSLMKNGQISSVEIEGVDEVYYADSQKLAQTKEPVKEVHLLNPFDNMVIQRNRLNVFFDFNYQIECYVSEPKRKYGYYCLPILYGNEFIGRLDPKADRKTGVFTVNSLWFEEGFNPTEEFVSRFNEQIQSFAKFCGCSKVEFKKVNPKEFKKLFITLH